MSPIDRHWVDNEERLLFVRSTPASEEWTEVALEHVIVQTWQTALFAYPYAALCADVGSPTRADWAQYAPGMSPVSVCG